MFSKIAIIGTGNIATWLFKTLQNQSNSEVVSISGRKIETLPKDFDLYIFALKDDVYEDVLQQVPFIMANAVHTSGSLSQNTLAPYSKRYGVVYPYQSISEAERNEEVPLCVEGYNPEFEEVLYFWAKSIFDIVHKVNEKQRYAMHMAAVFANNFTNAMYGIAYNIFRENNLDWSLIFPLLENTLEKAKHNIPQSIQTGPAKRGDDTIMKKHYNAIKDIDLKEVYQLISKIIQHQHH